MLGRKKQTSENILILGLGGVGTYLAKLMDSPPFDPNHVNGDVKFEKTLLPSKGTVEAYTESIEIPGDKGILFKKLATGELYLLTPLKTK